MLMRALNESNYCQQNSTFKSFVRRSKKIKKQRLKSDMVLKGINGKEDIKMMQHNPWVDWTHSTTE